MLTEKQEYTYSTHSGLTGWLLNIRFVIYLIFFFNAQNAK